METKNKIILIFRIFLLALTLYTIIAGWTMSAIASGIPFIWLPGLKYYTTQTNLMVCLWLILAIIWCNNPEKLRRVMGPLKGAITLYITTTFFFFAVLLQSLYHPTGFAAFSNIVLHYLTPILFIVDWILTENEFRYKWWYLPIWTLYPIGYLVFSFVHGSFTGDYLYPFLNVSFLGIVGYLLILCFLIGFGLIFGSVYIGINKLRTRKLK